MNYRKANWGFLGMVLLHFAVVIVLLVGRITSMNILLNLFLSEMMLVVPAGAALLTSGERPVRVLCFHGLKFTSVLMVLVFTFLMGPLTTLLNAVSMLFVDNAVTDMSGQILEYPFPVMFFMMTVFGPVCEELCFRGILYRGYLKSGNAAKAVLLSALLFGLIHMNFNQAPYAFALGVAMALLMEATGSLLAPILMHVIFNAQSVVLMYVYDRFFPWILEAQAQQGMGAQELLPTICVYLVLALVCTALAGCVLVWLCRNQGREEYIRWLIREQKEDGKKGKLASAPLIVGIVLCLAYMILLAAL
ncbi:MAG TPA: CPBP family intramembrane metalloprotease [Candidatus Eisenbergiella merdipullorum]|uniref:CPBP family intramembrane metalloprotease n=1 Tax=Candidatus Eisenbergiella merdipullorum TaxID=2838553 RepID=A0A9D2I987_9FIRM|nr:CPBP family intramembrane metalloprotease [Candidatus Eisenbergiella merdipullorum]